jgi:hypothetical protein
MTGVFLFWNKKLERGFDLYSLRVKKLTSKGKGRKRNIIIQERCAEWGLFIPTSIESIYFFKKNKLFVLYYDINSFIFVPNLS